MNNASHRSSTRQNSRAERKRKATHMLLCNHCYLCVTSLIHGIEDNVCQCANSWTSPDDGDECANTQNGCTNCDDDDSQWCEVANPGCTTDEGRGWSYCGK